MGTCGASRDLHKLIEIQYGLIYIGTTRPRLETLMKDGRTRVVDTALVGIRHDVVLMTAAFVSAARHNDEKVL